MKLLLNSNDIKNAIKAIQPQNIAVAYIGIDYEDFIDTTALQSIIVSPTLGSNPKAIGNISSQIGWEKVSFLDNLHSKIYIGGNSAVLASANLSSNALSGSGLFETGVLIDDKATLKAIKEQFFAYWKESNIKYPTINSKKVKLQKLHNDYKRFKKYFPRNKQHKDTLINFDAYSVDKQGNFMIVWWYPNDTPLNENEIQKHVLLQEDQDITDIGYYLFSPKDDIKENTWLLEWKITTKDKVSKSANLGWFYIDKIVANGAKDDIFSTAAIQLEGHEKEAPPFQLDSSFKNAFSKVIEKKKYDCFRGINKEEWYWNDCEPLFESLISEIKKEYKK